MNGPGFNEVAVINNASTVAAAAAYAVAAVNRKARVCRPLELPHVTLVSISR